MRILAKLVYHTLAVIFWAIIGLVGIVLALVFIFVFMFLFF